MPVDDSSRITWEVERLRLTGFPVTPPPLEGNTWWNDLVGDDPDTRVTNPKRGELVELGEYEDAQLMLQVTLSRIDWFLSTKDFPMTNLPAIGPFDERCGAFVELVSKWLELDTAPSLNRLAFGAVLAYPAVNRIDGYTKIQPYLPCVTIDSEKSSDLAYQINRPREAQTPISGLHINRLSKWSISRLQLVTIEATGIKSPVERYACRLELDINTAPDFEDELPQEHLVSVYNEMAALGKEIAEKGDVP